MTAGNMHWALYALLILVVTALAIYAADVMLERRAERKEYLANNPK